MDELRELRVYMLGVGIFACLLRIAIILTENIELRRTVICLENLAFDVASHWLSFWS